jgi:hypothetical protein
MKKQQSYNIYVVIKADIFLCAACRSIYEYFVGNSLWITLLSNLWHRTTFLVIKKPEGRGTMLKIYRANPHFPEILLG